MENTGRIRKSLAPAAQRILFSRPCDRDIEDELWHISHVDQAHVLMLSECGIVARSRAVRLLAAIDRLREQNFAPLLDRPMPRGLFLAYEDYLIETEGFETGGILQTARSRNDLNATVLKLRIRRPWLRVLEEGLRLHAILLRRARRHSTTVMPVYTHGQAAMPVTYGHYLAGIAMALMRHFRGLLSVRDDMQCCALGAGAVAGSSFPIRTEMTAQWLGFASGPPHSIDAVASRDLPLRLLAAASIYALELSRLAADLLLWTTAEFDFIHLPDELVGSSSAMPQKRNPFLLEHIQGRAMALLGAFVQCSASMHATPFTNSIAVGTEAMKPLWNALQSLEDIIVLARLVVAGAEPNDEAMMRRAVQGFTVATALADRLVSDGIASFRKAHWLIGSAVLETLARGTENLQETATSCVRNAGIPASFEDLNPASVVQALEFGGGPGPLSFKANLDMLKQQWSEHYGQKQSQKKVWQQAEMRLEGAVKKFISATAEEKSGVLASQHS